MREGAGLRLGSGLRIARARAARQIRTASSPSSPPASVQAGASRPVPCRSRDAAAPRRRPRNGRPAVTGMTDPVRNGAVRHPTGPLRAAPAGAGGRSADRASAGTTCASTRGRRPEIRPAAPAAVGRPVSAAAHRASAVRVGRPDLDREAAEASAAVVAVADPVRRGRNLPRCGTLREFGRSVFDPDAVPDPAAAGCGKPQEYEHG